MNSILVFQSVDNRPTQGESRIIAGYNDIRIDENLLENVWYILHNRK
jgi:hypothetical protein